MTEPHSTQSPFARLVLFMVCLAIAGTIIAGAHYLAIDRPQQERVQAPENGNSISLNEKCNTCRDNCKWLPTEEAIWKCWYNCELIC